MSASSASATGRELISSVEPNAEVSKNSSKPVGLVTSTPQEAEVRILADQLASSYRRLVENFRIHLKLDAVEADEELRQRLLAELQPADEDDEFGVRGLPPSEVD